MGRRIRSRGRSESRMPGRVPSGPEVQPAELPARAAPAGVTAGRVAATKVAASGVAASASVLRLCGREETDHGEQDQKDTRGRHKEGSSSVDSLATAVRAADGFLLMFGNGQTLRECFLAGVTEELVVGH